MGYVKATVTQTQAKEGNNGNSSELFDLKLPIAFGYIQGLGGSGSGSGVREEGVGEDGVPKTQDPTLKTFTVGA